MLIIINYSSKSNARKEKEKLTCLNNSLRIIMQCPFYVYICKNKLYTNYYTNTKKPIY